MDILKYLDVLIGLAVVMVLLSPLVSAITQLCVWALNMRAARLEFALKQLILQLNGNPYERFEAVRLSGVPADRTVTLGPPALGDVEGVANPRGEVTFQDDVPGRLKHGQGALMLVFKPPLPSGTTAPLATFLARGPVGGWEITTTTDAKGVATAKYQFPGPAQFASHTAEVVLPAGTILSEARITSEPMRGTALLVTAGPPVKITYPPNAQPVPASHDIQLTVAPPGGQAASQTIRLKFERNTSFDRAIPIGGTLQAPTSLSAERAGMIARAALLHPMIAQPPFLERARKWIPFLFGWVRKRMRGEVIEREELIRVLLEFAAGEGPGGAALPEAERAALRRVLAENDVAAPGRALAAIRTASQRLEQTKPETAAHTRLTAAILEGASSAFVGKVNNWFDQAMDRTIAAYRFRTQIITVFAAAVVSLAIQMDSIDLLKRLSTDDKLRNALVDQAKEQQRRIEELTKATPAAGANRRAAASENPETPEQNPAAAGGKPEDQKPAARKPGEASGKPATNKPAEARKPVADKPTEAGKPAAAEPRSAATKEAVVLEDIELARVRRDEIETNLAKLRDPSLAILPEHFIWQPLPEGSLVPTPNWWRAEDWQPLKRLELVAGASTYPIEPSWPTTGRPGDPLVAVQQAINNAGTPVTARIELAITGTKLRDDVRVTSKNGKNLLKLDTPSQPSADRRTARLAKASLLGGQGCAVWTEKEQPVECDVDKIVAELKTFDPSLETSDTLVLESRRNPPLQLRTKAGHPETNLLGGELKWKCSGWTLVPLSSWLGPDWSDVCFDYPMLKQSWLGVLVTWMLLSLGAPFWYDMLKDLLKLRSTLAKKEEAARQDRQEETKKPAPAK